MTVLRIATRTSALAIAQSELVAARLRTAHPGLTTELVGVNTTGDTDRTSPIAALTEMGAFVRSVQTAVLDGRADIAVHSCKDLPTESPLDIAAFPERANPYDVLVGARWSDLPTGAIIGTGSPRRVEQLKSLRNDLGFIELRGNVETRISKIASGAADAAVLAHAGLSRLGRQDSICSVFDLEEMVPAPAQGIIAVEAKPDSEAHSLVATIDDAAVRRQAETERGLLIATGAGCRTSLAALAVLHGDDIAFTVFVADGAGPRRVTVTATSPEAAIEAARSSLEI